MGSKRILTIERGEECSASMSSLGKIEHKSFGTRTYTHTHIYCHPQTDCFVLSELCNVARHVGCSKPGSKPIQLFVRLSLRPLGQQAYQVWPREFLRYYVVTAAAVCLYFYTLSATRLLNSFEELCIMPAAAENSFTRVLNHHGGAYIYIYVYIYIYNQTLRTSRMRHKISF